jgi:hypothetical protein
VGHPTVTRVRGAEAERAAGRALWHLKARELDGVEKAGCGEEIEEAEEQHAER